MIIGYIEFTLRANSLPLLLKILGYYGGEEWLMISGMKKRNIYDEYFFLGSLEIISNRTKVFHE